MTLRRALKMQLTGRTRITISPEWDSYEAFSCWALSHGYEDGLAIERTEVNGHYTPGNCIFIPRPDQNRNKQRTRLIEAFGETKRIPEWAQDPRCHPSLNRHTLSMRFLNGWDPERAITEPSRARRPKRTVEASSPFDRN
jgi:hypothetical protein